MEKIAGAISFIVVGVFVITHPTFSHRGGTTDLSFMHFNIFFGAILVSFGVLLMLSKGKNNDESS